MYNYSSTLFFYCLTALEIQREGGYLVKTLEDDDLHWVLLLDIFHLVSRCVSPVSLHLDVDVMIWQVEVRDIVPSSTAPRGVLELETWVSYPLDAKLIQTLGTLDFPCAIHGDN